MAQSKRAGGSDGRDDSPLFRAKLAVEPDQDAPCVLLSGDTDSAVIAHELKIPPSCPEHDESGRCDPVRCGRCHTHLGDGGDTYISARPTDGCICPVLKAHSCLTRLEAVRSGTLVVTVVSSRRAELFDLIDDLRTVAATVSIDWITTVDGEGETITVDTDVITDTQRDTLETALNAGHYEGGATLSDLAARLGLSESAVSQRLNAAETRLVRAFLGEISDSDPT
ncbi:winged helix-turn-helix transcriptional regulator [Halovenus sp. WSH3]|uniref:Winged helix-turn-helix transcriptional regulator n=1 Tax=Halovenus carboxidivorans TaxID=2692199 RepID=A0A6B0T811_9EURY|nr:helix-turn-helix domain-containing protein [Halovenus carboxidivorans]MXR51442.1 winged helix-turn-helix transcriptional regulator [Halovenus carboxidivorans]